MQFWSKAFLDLSVEHKDYWRARLVTWVLLITSFFFFILFVINALYFKHLDVSLIDAVGFVIAFSIYLQFRRNANIEFACWACTILVTIILMLFVVIVGGYSHSLFWATLIPPIAFFLVGSKWGTLISVLCFSVCIGIVYQQVQSQTEVVFGTGALLNVIEVCIAHILLFRFYEHSRASAYKQLRLRNAEIITLSETDKLTQLFNRDKLDKAFSAIAQHSAKNKQPLSVIMLDIDHFKKINDEHGHLEGDRVLSELATELNAMMRKHDLLARWGGEEFMVLLQDTPLSIAQELAQRLRIRISEKPLSNKQVTVSVGVGEYAPPESTDAFFERVDAALYKAKRNGRNQVSVAQ